MSDIRGTLRRGKQGESAVAELEGKLEPKQWEELIEALRALARKYPKLAVRVRKVKDV